MTRKATEARVFDEGVSLVPFASPYRIEPEAAAYLRLAADTLRKLRVSGRGPRYREHGGKIVYTQADLDRWSDGRVKLSTSDVVKIDSNNTTP
jgi:hypothetical protein